MSVAVLIDKFVSATALIKFKEVERTLSERKAKEVLPTQPQAALALIWVQYLLVCPGPGHLGLAMGISGSG